MFTSSTKLFQGITPASGAYQISRSLRFNSADSTYLVRTPSVNGNRQIWTFSGWVKRAALGSNQNIIRATDGGSNDTLLRFETSDAITVYTNAASNLNLQTTSVYRDTAAFLHVLLAVDTTQATASNRAKLYVNGVQVTAFTTETYPTQNANTQFNSTSYAMNIGRYASGAGLEYFSGYMTEINFIDGQALTPSSFGQTDSATGVWSPIAYTGTYGTNGFYLNFSDNSGTTSTTLGKDYSGNGNNFTPNNFSVTAGAGNDSLVDSPTNYGTDTGVGGEVRGNYCTWNPLNTGRLETLSNGNLDASIAAGAATGDNLVGTLGISSGKWYWETVFSTTATPTPFYGYITGILVLSSTQSFNDLIAYAFDGTKTNLGSTSSYGATWVAGDVIGVALDMTAGTIAFYKNGVSQGTAISGLTGTVYPGVRLTRDVGYGTSVVTNFGQRPFAYTAPSGFKALCTQNLPTPTIGTTSTTQADDYFNVVLWTGANTSATISVTGTGFKPDFVWAKARSRAFSHTLYDSVRGTGKGLFSNATDAEVANDALGYVSSFDSDGFTATVGASNNNYFNNTSTTYVSWQWKAGGTASTNTSGTITSNVSVSTTAGFSVVTYTGTGTAATIGHGLGAAPKMVIIKSRSDAGTSWIVYHSSISPSNLLTLQTTAAQQALPLYFNSNATTSTVFSIGSAANSGTDLNVNTKNYVAYCFAEIEGFSKFGSYTGNGSTDGPFLYCGFRPRWILVKLSAGGTDNWMIYDTARSTFNDASLYLQPSSSNAEGDITDGIDILSNGFKIRGTNSTMNTNTWTYVFAAFAESPFNYSRAR